MIVFPLTKKITYNWEMRKEGREGRKGGRGREEGRGQGEGEGGSP